MHAMTITPSITHPTNTPTINTLYALITNAYALRCVEPWVHVMVQTGPLPLRKHVKSDGHPSAMYARYVTIDTQNTATSHRLSR